MASQVRVTDAKNEWLATVDGPTVTIEGVEGTFLVKERPDGRWTIEHANGTRVAAAAKSSDGVWIALDGGSTLWQTRPASARARHVSVDNDVRAPMSATVVRLKVAPGDQVAEGDILVVVEAMKMEMPLRAPRRATVRAVNCREGELVQPASILVELE